MYISEITKYVYFIFSYLVHPLPLILDMVVVVQGLNGVLLGPSPPEQKTKKKRIFINIQQLAITTADHQNYARINLYYIFLKNDISLRWG